MPIIVGLGNPGAVYEKTRHNVGFKIVDQLAKQLNLPWKKKDSWKAQIAEGVFEGNRILLVKPQTFMNKSGESVQAIIKNTPFTPQDILVISDDADLPFGSTRLRSEGSSGGQKGLKSIIEAFPEDKIERLRFGIGRPNNEHIPLDEWVLGKWSEEEEKELPVLIDQTINEILQHISS